jgi:hypothetical protein
VVDRATSSAVTSTICSRQSRTGRQVTATSSARSADAAIWLANPYSSVVMPSPKK